MKHHKAVMARIKAERDVESMASYKAEEAALTRIKLRSQGYKAAVSDDWSRTTAVLVVLGVLIPVVILVIGGVR